MYRESLVDVQVNREYEAGDRVNRSGEEVSDWQQCKDEKRHQMTVYAHYLHKNIILIKETENPVVFNFTVNGNCPQDCLMGRIGRGHGDRRRWA